MNFSARRKLALVAAGLALAVGSPALAQQDRYESFYPSEPSSPQPYQSFYTTPSGVGPVQAQPAGYAMPPNYMPQPGYSQQQPGYSQPQPGYPQPQPGYPQSQPGYPQPMPGPGGPPYGGATPEQLEQLYGPTPGGYGFDEGGCDTCGSAACGGCGGGLLSGWLGGGAYCQPRNYDVHAEFMYLARSQVGSYVEFSRDGLLGPTVLSTDNLGFGERPGFRITGHLDVGVYATLEASYFGTFNWSTSAQAVSPNDNLYSAFSDFGFAPPGGFEDVDQARLHAIEYTSQLHNAEINLRRPWSGPRPRLQGSWMLGVRYFQLKERFNFFADVALHDDPFTGLPRGPAYTESITNTQNDLVGFQVGGDLWLCVMPRLMLGTDLKLGIYGNQVQVDTRIDSTSLGNDPVLENSEGANAAFLGEANFMVVYELTPSWTFRAGYQLLYVDGVALAVDNFDSTPPFVSPTARTPSVNDSGDVFYHGFTVGLEWNY